MKMCLNILFTSLLLGIAYPCSCQELPPPEEAYEMSNVVFSGQVTNVIEDWNNGFMEISIDVHNVWKGIIDNQIIILTGLDDCGYYFQINEEYLIYGYYSQLNYIWTDICTRTNLLEYASEDLEYLNGLNSNQVYGYLRESAVSDCQDACSQYYIEPEIDGGFGTVPIIFQNSNINLDLYMNRFVEVDLGQEVTCVECSAFEINQINLSDECQFPVNCFENPCYEVEYCDINIPVECIANYCGGCYADFYDLEGNLVDCNASSNECIDLSGLDFGACAMELGIGYVNGECSYVSGCGWILNGIDYSDAFFDSIDECDEQCSNYTTCDEIEENYLELHSEEYTECEYDIDCMSVWGDCDISLGGCHYAVNILNYPEEEINEQVALWLENECMSSVCDCMDLPNVVCNNNNCELAYCSEPNPAGCIQTGCQEGYECVYDVECTSSECHCDDNYGYWSCNEDCGGGTCIEVQNLGDINNDSLINVQDIILLVSFVLQTDFPDDTEFMTADVNGDGILNILDVVSIVDLILNPQVSIQINSGTSYGNWWGYCVFELELDNSNALFTSSSCGNYYDEFLDLLLEDNLSQEEWQQLVAHIDFEYFQSLDDVYGCPDCNDGGAEFIEIIYDGVAKQVTFEAYTAIDGIQELTILLRNLRDEYWNQINENQECYLMPEAGPCDGICTTYYYNQDSNECEEFIFGCCGPEAFDTMQGCIDACE